MKESRDCKIVQDLLPNYIESLTNDETNNFIEEHLKKCSECQKIFDNMKKEFKVDTAKRDEREVKYIKKYSKKLKTLKIILLIILVIYVLIVIRRTVIMTSLYRKTIETQTTTNYYTKSYSYQGNIFFITESYYKEGDYLTTSTSFVNGNEIQKTIYYKKGNERLFLRDSNGNKFMLDPELVIGEWVSPVTYVSDGLLANMQYAFIVGIDKTCCNGKECYVIKGNGYERYIDKETGLAVREIEKSNKEISRQTDIVSDYYYEFNVVKDSDIVRPDTTDYILNE